MAEFEAQISEERGTGRLEAFSDGVFGIAITLLVLDIRLPDGIDPTKAGSLVPGLLNLWPVYLAYLVSFLSICVMWMSHHDLFHVIRHTDRGLLLINSLLLLAVTFVNFPTVIIDEYFRQPDGHWAALFYSGTMFMISLLFNILWWYATARPHLLKPNFEPGNQRKLTRKYLVGPIGDLIAVLLAFVSVPLSVLTCLLVLGFFVFPLRISAVNRFARDS